MTTQTSSTFGNIAGAFAAVALVLGALALVPFIAMLLLGALHADVLPVIPALGFWASVILTVSIAFFGAVWNGTLSSK